MIKLPKPEVLISESRIRRRVAALGRKISSDYAGKDLTVIFISSGAVVFAADLIRNIKLPMHIDCIRASSYASGMKSSGRVKLTSGFKVDIRGRHVLLVDDILDSGRTLGRIIRFLKKYRPADIRTCVLLDKAARREIPLETDYAGFAIPDVFVYGYGLDYREYCRNLPYVAYLKD